MTSTSGHPPSSTWTSSISSSLFWTCCGACSLMGRGEWIRTFTDPKKGCHWSLPTLCACNFKVHACKILWSVTAVFVFFFLRTWRILSVFKNIPCNGSESDIWKAGTPFHKNIPQKHSIMLPGLFFRLRQKLWKNRKTFESLCPQISE